MQKKFLYHYSISNQHDDFLFKRQCDAIERHIPGLIKERVLEDVDGSSYQHYRHESGEIRVSNDCYVGALYVDADFDLLPYFERLAKTA